MNTIGRFRPVMGSIIMIESNTDGRSGRMQKAGHALQLPTVAAED